MAAERQVLGGRGGPRALAYQSLEDEESPVFGRPGVQSAGHVVAVKRGDDSDEDDFAKTALAQSQWDRDTPPQSPPEAYQHDGTETQEGGIRQHLTTPLVIAIAQALVGVSLFGYNISLFNIPEDTIRNHAAGSGHYISNSLWGVINGMYPLGAGVGSLTTGYFADRFGRKKVFFANSVLVIASSMVVGSSFHIAILIIGRLMTGMTSGIAMAVGSMYLNEISPNEIRGVVGTLMQVLLTFMIFFTVAIGKLWCSDPLWRLGCAVPAFFMAVQLLTFTTFPESPKWLAANGRVAEAREILTRLRGSATKAAEELREDMQADDSAENLLGTGASDVSTSVSLFPAAANDSEAAPMTMSPQIRKRPKDGGTELLLKDQFLREWALLNDQSIGFMEAYKESKLMRRVVWVSILINVLQQLSGVNLVFYYSGYLLSEAGVKGAWIGSAIVCFFNWISVMFIIPYIDVKGRRYWLLASCFGMFLSALAITVCFYGIKHWSKSIWGYPTVLCLVIYVATFEIGLGPITWMIISEMAPTRHRASVTAVAQLANWGFNILIATSSTMLLDTLHAFGFLPFAVICILGYFWVMKYVPETANKPVMQIMSDIYETF